MSSLSPDSVAVAVREQLASQGEEGISVLNLKTGTYYALDRVGSRVWELVQNPRRIQEILEHLLEEFNVEAEECETDLRVLLQEMAIAGLVEVTDPTIKKGIPR